VFTNPLPRNGRLLTAYSLQYCDIDKDSQGDELACPFVENKIGVFMFK
jgi:hypothetical protein